MCVLYLSGWILDEEGVCELGLVGRASDLFLPFGFLEEVRVLEVEEEEVEVLELDWFGLEMKVWEDVAGDKVGEDKRFWFVFGSKTSTSSAIRGEHEGERLLMWFGCFVGVKTICVLAVEVDWLLVLLLLLLFSVLDPSKQWYYYSE